MVILGDLKIASDETRTKLHRKMWLSIVDFVVE